MTTFIQCGLTKEFLLAEQCRVNQQLNELERHWCSSHKHVSVFTPGGKRPGAGSLFIPKHMVVKMLRDYRDSIITELANYD